jgi:Lrp/AsnC family transcriptional regulator, leucine-responsive regulatory protein
MAENSQAPIRIDDLDRQILGALVHQGRLSFQELGRLVHLSANSAADRVRRLQRSGVISGYVAELSLPALGRTLLALSDTKLHPEVDRLEFEGHLADVPQVLTATHTTGEYDYQIRLACIDTADLEDVVDRLRALGVRDIHSRIVLSEIDFDRARLVGRSAGP